MNTTQTQGAHRNAPLAILIILIFAAHALFYFFALGTDAVDDAFISFRYAQNAIRGAGLVFNPNERVEGFTNFLWTAASIPLEGARVDVGRASMLIGALFALGTLWLVTRFTRVGGIPRAVGALAALLLAADGSFVLWGVAGLETPLFAFLIFAGAVLYVQEQRLDAAASPSLRGAEFAIARNEAKQSPSNLEIASHSAGKRGAGKTLAMTDHPRSHLHRTPSGVQVSAFIRVLNDFPKSGIFFALAAMTRPEGALVFAITVAHQAALRLLFERRLFVARDLARIFAFVAIFAPYWLARWWYYKSFLPNSFHAKVAAAGPAAQIERGWNHLSQFVNVHWGWLILLPPLYLLSRVILSAAKNLVMHWNNQSLRYAQGDKQSFWVSYFALILIVYSAYIVYVGGDWSVGRFFAPLMPFFYLLFSTGVYEFFRRLVEKRSTRGAERANNVGIIASGALAALLFSASSFNGEYGIYIRGFDAANATRARETMGKWLKLNTPRGALIAVDAAGQVPYFAELPAVDMFGINDAYIGRLNVPTLGQGTPGHEKFDLGYVIIRQPQYVVIFGTLFDAVKEYERDPREWTNDEALKKFLTLYRRRQ